MGQYGLARAGSPADAKKFRVGVVVGEPGLEAAVVVNPPAGFGNQAGLGGRNGSGIVDGVRREECRLAIVVGCATTVSCVNKTVRQNSPRCYAWWCQPNSRSLPWKESPSDDWPWLFRVPWILFLVCE